MSACKKVKQWVTKKVQVPVEEAIYKAKKFCEKLKKKIEEKVQKPVEKWVSKQEKKCKKRKCKWACLCCNKWFCWLVTVFVKVVTWVVVTIIKWVTYTVCKTIMILVDVIVKIVVRVFKFLVTFIVCIFTEPLEAIKAIWELWKDLLDILDDIFEYLKGLICGLLEFVDDVKRLTCALTESTSWVGVVLFGLVDGGLGLVQGIYSVLCDFLGGLKDIVMGILNLNGCRISGGLTEFGTGIGHAIKEALGAIGKVFVSGIAGNVRRRKMKQAIDDALNAAFGDDTERIERIKDEMRFDSCPMGLPVTLDARRMCIPSTDHLRRLHATGKIDLFVLAGQVNDCGKDKWATSNPTVLGEAVYTGTQSRVSYFDLKRFLDEGPDAVPPFNVYPMKLQRFEQILHITKLKGYQLGLEFSWDEIRDFPITSDNDPKMQFVPMDQDVHEEVFTDFPRNGVNDPLCHVPVLALFRYLDDDPSFGLTSWFRPPPYETLCSGPGDSSSKYVSKSGVSFTDRPPQFVFSTVLAHELGHYFGLCHDGHDGLEYIMYAPAEAKKDFTGHTLLEFLLLSGEPSFTNGDVKEVWRWLTNVAADTCLFP